MGNRVVYAGNSGTKTASLNLFKLVMNSVISRKGAKFINYNIQNYYLSTPLDYPEYVKINLTDIPQEFIDEYNLHDYVYEGWVYSEIRNGIYGLPQSGSLANALLETRLLKHNYYQCPQTPGLWRRKWRPVLFYLIVDDFGVEYVGKRHTDHLLNALKKNYEVTVNDKGDLYAGINLTWYYLKLTSRLTMDDYIANLRAKFNQPNPNKPPQSLHRHTPIIYGVKVQYAAETPSRPPLDKAGKLRIQQLVGAICYYARAVDKKLLLSLSDISQQHSSPTKDTTRDMLQLLDYLATFPDDGITYCVSGMIHAGHENAAYLNVSQACSRAGDHIMLSEDVPIPLHSSPLLTIAQIIKNVMSSASKAELVGLFTISK